MTKVRHIDLLCESMDEILYDRELIKELTL